MLNQVVLVGRLTKDPILYKNENNKEYSYITLAIPRSFKNQNGEYETDFIDCQLWDGVAKSTVNYCKKGNIVGVKGRISSYLKEIEEQKQTVVNVIAEKITFLSSKDQEAKEKA